MKFQSNLKNLLEDLKEGGCIGGSKLETLKKYKKQVSKYYNIDAEDINIVGVNISNAIQLCYIGLDYEDFSDIIEDAGLLEDLEGGYISCFTLASL